MKRAAAVALAIFLALAAVGYLLLATETGLHWLARGAECSFDHLKIGQAAGSVLGGFSLRNLSYRDERVSIVVRELGIAWRPQDLLRGILHLKTVRLQEIQVVQTASAAQEPRQPRLPDLGLVLDVAIDDWVVHDAYWRRSEAAEPVRLERIGAALKVQEGRMMIERLLVRTRAASVSLSGMIAPAEQRAIDLSTTWGLELLDRPKIAGSGTIIGNLSRIETAQQMTAPMPASLKAEVLIREDAVSWNAGIDLPEFSLERIDRDWPSWPFSARLKSEGTGREAKVFGDFALIPPDIGPAQGSLSLNYRGPDELTLESLVLRVPKTGTEVAFSGQARDIQKVPKVNLKAQWKDLFWPLAADSEWRSSEGRLSLAGTRSDLRFELDGHIREQRVQARGNIGFPPEAIVVRDFRVDSASTMLMLDGIWGPQMNLRWILRIDDLGVWLPSAKGRMASSGRLEGKRSAPAVEADFDAAGLRFRDYAARDVNVRFKAGAEPTAPVIFDLRGSAVRFKTYTATIVASGRGSRERHRLNGRIDSPPYAMVLEGEGGLRADTWSGVLTRFDLEEPRTGSWTLREPAELRLAQTRSELKEICWINRNTRWCFDGAISKTGEWQVSTRLSDFPLDAFESLLPRPVPIFGVLNGRAAIRGKDTRIDRGFMNLDAEGTAFDLSIDESKKVRVKPETTSVNANLSGRVLTVQLRARQTGLVDIQGSLESRGEVRLGRLQELPLSGHLTADLESLAAFEPWLQQLEDLRGSVRADVRLQGSANDPRIELDALVLDGGFRVPRLGVGIEHVMLRATSVEQRQIRLDGSAISGGGSVRMGGLWRLNAAAGWPLSLNLEGTRFLSVDTPEARVLLSPSLEITTYGQQIHVRGQVIIPEASVNIPKQEQAVTPSKDVVLMDGEPLEKESAFPLQSDVQVHLGDKIQVKAAGFRGRVDGSVRIVQAPNEEARGIGEIVVHNGTYSFHGVDLDIDDGRLLFTNTPVDNPGLDVTVTRKLDEVLAGVRVLGSVKKPDVTLYSTPPLPEADILAYLVAGKPMDFAPREEGDRLRSAAASLGGVAGSMLARQISSRFGLGGLLDQIGIETPNGAEATSLFLGKYLTPRLYLQYGLGLFQSSNTFRLRYKLNKHWRLQSETGEQSGADILFEWQN